MKNSTIYVILAALLLSATIWARNTEFGQKASNHTKITFPENAFYDLRDGSIIPTNTDGKSDIEHGAFRLFVGNKNGYSYNGAQHGSVLKEGNTIELDVAGSCTIEIGGCQYSNGTISVASPIGSFNQAKADSKTTGCYHNTADVIEFRYTGEATTITLSFTGGNYIPAIKISAIAAPTSNGLADVWDFGAEQLNTELYNNLLTEEFINSLYTAAPGTAGIAFASSFTAGRLSWVGGTSDRLRTSNTALTRYDNNVGAQGYTGRLYVNASAATGRYLSLTLTEDDEVTVIAGSQNGKGALHFINTTDKLQDDIATLPTAPAEIRFVAKHAGTYQMYDSEDKPSYYRIIRKDAVYATVSGSIHTTATDLPSNYSVLLTNDAGKEWKATVQNKSFSVKVPAEYRYTLALADANGFIISSEKTFTAKKEPEQLNITIEKINLTSVSGNIVGLSEAVLKKLSLIYTPNTEKTFVPQPIIKADGSYTVEIEPNCEYTITAEGVNDYVIPSNKIIATETTMVKDITFEAKPRHVVTITSSGLSTEQMNAMQLTFTNLKEEGYTYPFQSISNIALRDGTYAIACQGLDTYPLELSLTSNLQVKGGVVSKELTFNPVHQWPFNDQEITTGTTAYKGLLFTGTISNEIAKGHLVGRENSTIRIPVNPSEKVIISFYYSANFTINGGENITTTTSTGSTGKTDMAEYAYSGNESGYVTITCGTGSTYITNIATVKTEKYAEKLYVGKKQTYKTVNEALSAVRNMVRANNERVSILIEPGNYEEMLVVDMPNISLVNAAVKPSIGLLNKGVDIEENAVRITSYYGHGYSYYSMGNDHKWNTDVLRVNKENGYLSYVNAGSGTTNGSYWNATVVIAANGFEAQNIIFENSFNQYISQKESEDVVVEWVTGGKGIRPTNCGNTAVQEKSFVERAAAVALTNDTDKAIFNNCRIIGRQDSFYGGTNARVAIYKGVVMGACDYIFGGMTAVFYQTELAMNTSEDKNDVSYITAAQQSSGRGYLMYQCKVTSAVPGTETASTYRSKPGYFGRPWQAQTSEVVFYNTTVETTDFAGSEGKSLIVPSGWNNSLGGESNLCYEYGTIEKSGENNTSARAAWTSLLTEPTLKDGTAISTFNFTKGTDNWDPIKTLIDTETGIFAPNKENLSIQIKTYGNEVSVTGIKSDAGIYVYTMNGTLIKTYRANSDMHFSQENGLWIVRVITADGSRSGKVIIR